jgi:hypothetical protein
MKLSDETKELLLFAGAVTVAAFIIKGLIYNTTWAGKWF